MYDNLDLYWLYDYHDEYDDKEALDTLDSEYLGYYDDYDEYGTDYCEDFECPDCGYGYDECICSDEYEIW